MLPVPRSCIRPCIHSLTTIAGLGGTGIITLLNLPLIKNLTLVSGTSPVTWTHTTGYIIKDHEGVYVACLPGEAGIDGGRRVANYIRHSNDLTQATWAKETNVTVIDYRTLTSADSLSVFRRTTSTVQGTVVVGQEYRITCLVTLVSGSPNFKLGFDFGGSTSLSGVATTTPTPFTFSRTVVTATDNLVELYVDGTSTIRFENIHVELVNGATNKNPSGHVATGATAPVAEWRDTANANTVNGSGVVTYATGAALTTIKGVACDPGAQNKCTNWGMRPDSALVNITKGGDVNSALVRTLKQAEVIAAGWGDRNPEGYLVTLDNSAGVTVATATFTGTTTNLLKHSGNAWIMGGTGRIMLTGGVGPVTFGASSELVNIKSENITPLATTDQLVIEVNPGQIVHFMANQMTQTAYVGRPIEVAGTAVSTTAASGTLPVGGNLGLAEGAVYCELTPVALGSLIGPAGIIGGNATTRRIMYLASGILSMYDGTTAFTVGSALESNTTYKVACSYSTAAALMALSINGVSTQRTYTGSFSTINLLQLGTGVAGPFPGAIKNLKTYPTYKTAAELKAMTL